ncbi:MAG: ferritin-like domain-containing protein [Myxococcaceae bacterium]
MPAHGAALAESEARRLLAVDRLTLLLQLAYSGELAATRAYLGHRHSVRRAAERREIGTIVRDEIEHRHCILGMLEALGSGPNPARERKMARVGRSISTFCQVGGWFFPMYGAARLEAQNIREYALAARLAVVARRHPFVDPLLQMAEVEWDHELYFREKAASHWLWTVMPKWPLPPPREDIRASFKVFDAVTWVVPVVQVPWLVR